MKYQSGNALFLILIAVALFAALSYAVTSSGRGNSSIEREERQIALSKTNQYLSSVQNAIQRLKLIHGCSEGALSFHYDSDGDGTLETNGDDDYYNSASSNDCNVFHVEGGNLSISDPPSGLNDGSSWMFLDNALRQSSSSLHQGTSANELVMMLPNVDNQICDDFNNQYSGKAVWESGGSHNGGSNVKVLFTGNYNTATQGINLSGDLAPLTGCFCDDSGPCADTSPRFFYHTLLVR